jgi:hypothetical protein
MAVLTLVGGPFDGDTMRFHAWQSTIVVPESIDGPGHVYSVAADGTAQYRGLPGDHVDKVARLLFVMHREGLGEDDPLPWEMADEADQESCLRDAARIVAVLGEEHPPA